MQLSFFLAAIFMVQLGSDPVRPPVSPLSDSAPMDPAVFAEAVIKLHEIGVVSDPEFWIANVKPGKFVESSHVRELMIAAAGKFEPVGSVSQAIDVLVKNRVFLNPEKWRVGVEKPKIASGDVIILISSLAKNIN